MLRPVRSFLGYFYAKSINNPPRKGQNPYVATLNHFSFILKLMAVQYEPWLSWKKILSWKAVLGFLVIIGGFSLGYYAQTYLSGNDGLSPVAITTSGQPPSDNSEDPYIIDFSHQGLLQFPQFLTNRKEITDLILSHNSIADLPEAISMIERLRVLDMRYNQLEGPVTSALASLQLVDLNLANNQLSSIPEEIGQIATLRYFDISHNRITQVPNSVTQLQDLKWLNLAGNNIASQDIDALREQMPSTIVNF